MVKAEIEKQSKKIQWGWLVGAVIAILLAVSLSGLPLFGRFDKPCKCAQVNLSILVLFIHLVLFSAWLVRNLVGIAVVSIYHCIQLGKLIFWGLDNNDYV